MDIEDFETLGKAEPRNGSNLNPQTAPRKKDAH